MRRAAAGADLSPEIARVQRWWARTPLADPALPVQSARMLSPITLYIDADACPVKSEVYRVAARFYARSTALKVVVVSNASIAVPYDRHS
jgi:hypothetical protein